MHYNAQHFLRCCFILMIFGMSACNQKYENKRGTVYIAKKEGKYQIFRNGAAYNIKGASGYTHLQVLKAAGGNTIRTWDTTQLSTILKNANQAGVAVIVGIPIPESRQMYFYNDQKKIDAQLLAIKKLINTYKANPAILMWCVGNELSFPYKPSFNKFYTAFNNIVDLIHQDDPDHPVTTTIVNFQRKDIFNIKLRTNIDLISFNIFGRLRSFKDDLQSFSWLYDEPYLITEWAIDGPWEGTPYTAWEAYLEPNSTQKAEYYFQRYTLDMPQDDPRYLGSFMFFWGQKQEVTATWFSLFDEQGNQTEAVATARQIWTGKKDNTAYPQIESMRLNNKVAADNIIFVPGQAAQAVLELKKGSIPAQQILWEVYQEDWYKKDNVNNNKPLTPVPVNFSTAHNLQFSFTAPQKEGPYRLFVKVIAANGHIANANIPFYISLTNDKN